MLQRIKLNQTGFWNNINHFINKKSSCENFSLDVLTSEQSDENNCLFSLLELLLTNWSCQFLKLIFVQLSYTELN